MSDQIVECHIENEWATLWLNRPDVRNALSSEMVASLRQHLTDLAQRDDVRGLTVRGRGGHFVPVGISRPLRLFFKAAPRPKKMWLRRTERAVNYSRKLMPFPIL